MMLRHQVKHARYKYNDLLSLFLFVGLLSISFLTLADYDLTDSVFEQAEIEKSASAQYTLGLMYLNGREVPKNGRLAVDWLKKSAEQDYYLAQYELGKLYFNGEVVETNHKTAIDYITLVANKGYAPAQYFLGTLHHSDKRGLDTAIVWYERAAKQGYAAAIKVLQKFPDKKGAYGKKAGIMTQSVDSETSFKKGIRYLEGKGVDRDYSIAAKWFTKAAEQGHANAQFRLGELYDKGHGFKKNKKMAQKWYKAASKQGHVKAKYRVGGCAFC